MSSSPEDGGFAAFSAPPKCATYVTLLPATHLRLHSHCRNVEIFTFAVSSLPPSDSPDPHQAPIKMLLLSYPAIEILYLLLRLPSTNGAPNCAVCWPVGYSQDPVVGFDFTLGYGYALTVTDDALLWVMTKASQNISCPIPERHLRQRSTRQGK